jgi:aminomethyltransferase
VGSEALAAVKANGGPKRRLVGLEIVERGIARDGYGVFDEAGQQIGFVTSGSPAPFLKKNIALAYVPPDRMAIDTEVFVQCRSNSVRAKVVPLPFYKRPRKQARPQSDLS